RGGMSSTTAPSGGLPATAPRGAAMPRLVSLFSGSVGLAVKIVSLSLVNALAVWSIYVLLTRHHWVAVSLLSVATLALDLLYLGRERVMPAKFLIPGTIFLVGFV